MRMCGLLNWDIYYHPLLQLLPPQLSLYVYFVLFMKSLYVFIPPLWHCMFTFISSLFIFTSPIWRIPCRCRPNIPRKLVMRWRWRALPYWLVHLCCHRPRHRPPWLDVYFFPPPNHIIDWRWRRRSLHASPCDKSVCHWLSNFMGGWKKTPDMDNFCEN